MRLSYFLRLTWIRFRIRFYPPYLGAGIRVRKLASDFSRLEADMPLRWWNKNYVGTQFGGSLYAMTDPFYMLLLIGSLGSKYVVWDKAATIRFKRPGRGRVRAVFELSKERLAEIKQAADTEAKTEPLFTVQVLDDENTVIAEVEKTLYVRRKPPPT